MNVFVLLLITVFVIGCCIAYKPVRNFFTIIGVTTMFLYLAGSLGIGHFVFSYGPTKFCETPIEQTKESTNE